MAALRLFATFMVTGLIAAAAAQATDEPVPLAPWMVEWKRIRQSNATLDKGEACGYRFRAAHAAGVN